MHLALQKRGGAYVIRFGAEVPDSYVTKENAIIYLNKQKSIIGFDVYPPQPNTKLCDNLE